MITAIDLARNTHRWVDVNTGAYGRVAHCGACGMGEFQATGLVCRGVRSIPCPTQSNARVQGTCAQQFDTTGEAQAHWSDTHRATGISR